MTGVAILMILTGGTLLYGAIRGYDPRSLVTGIFTGSDPTPLPPIPGLTPGTTATGTPLTGGTPPAASGSGQVQASVQSVWSAVQARYPKARSAGMFQCRRIAGSSTWSQHAWGNAVDIVGPTSLYMGRIAAWLLAEARANRLPIAQVLWQGKDLLSGGSVSGHYDHIHVSGRPMFSGTPPCAGLGDKKGKR